MRHNCLLFALLLITTTSAFSQNQNQSPLNTELDFWLGEWNLRWKDNDTTEATGTNSLTRELNNQVICEHYESLSGQSTGFKGLSWSVYDSRAKVWKQTWVDNQGGYLDFTGGKEGADFVFRRQFTNPSGKLIQQKMVFHDIQADRFTWDWMHSNDGGQSWQLAWQIFYTRR